MQRVGKVLILVLGLLLVTQCFAQSNPTPPFTQCPAVGYDTSCGILIVLTDSGATVLTDPSQGPYEGYDDMLVGVQNNTTQTTVYSLNLSSTKDIFNFTDSNLPRSDGLCGWFPFTDTPINPRPAGCPFGPALYEGPGTSFSNYSKDNNYKTGTVNFISAPGFVSNANGLPPGGSAYFTLENSNISTSLTISPSYNLDASALSASTASAGQSATSTITVTPVLPGSADAVTQQNIQLACSISPTPAVANAVACSFSPQTVSVSNAAVTSTLTIATVSGTAGSTVNNHWQLPLPILWLVVLGTLTLFAWKVMPRRKPVIVAITCATLLAIFLAACGKSSTPPTSSITSAATASPVTYSITVSGTPQQANTAPVLSLTVQ